MSTASRVRDAVRPGYRWLASRLPVPLRRRFLYLAGTRRPANFVSPRTFNEKVNWRILHDRRPQIVQACDKMAMKEHARSLVGPDELRVPETRWHGTDVASIPPAALAEPWVLKPNHSSGRILFGPRPGQDLAAATAGWLDDDQGRMLGEWGYSAARHELLLEERIPGPRPRDYKFFVFDGVPQVIQVNDDRDTEASLGFYDTQWRRYAVRDTRMAPVELDAPPQLARMVDLAARLSAGWDFIRVDLYDVDGEVWFGEFSPYPGGGVARFQPASFDDWLGRFWRWDKEVRPPRGD